MSATKLTFIITLNIIVLHFLQAQKEPKQGWTVGVSASSLKVGGDFDGTSALVSTNTNETFSVPGIEPAFGWGVTIGKRYKKTTMEFSYFRSEHTGTWVGFSETITQSAWSLDFKYYFLNKGSLQPFALIGWAPASPGIRVKNGAFDNTNSTFSDAIFISDIGNYNAGGGIAFYVTPRISILGTGVFRRIKINAIQSEEKKTALRIKGDNFKGSDFGYYFTAAFTF